MKEGKRTWKQVAKGTPATQPPTTRPAPLTHPEYTSDGPAEKKKAGGENDDSSKDGEGDAASPPR